MTKLKSDSNSEELITFNCCSTNFMNLSFTLFLRVTAKYRDFRNNNIPQKDFRNNYEQHSS